MNRLPTARYPDHASALRLGRNVAENIHDLQNFPNTKITPGEMIGNAIYNFACSIAEQHAQSDRNAIIEGCPCPSCGSVSLTTGKGEP